MNYAHVILKPLNCFYYNINLITLNWRPPTIETNRPVFKVRHQVNINENIVQTDYKARAMPVTHEGNTVQQNCCAFNSNAELSKQPVLPRV